MKIQELLLCWAHIGIFLAKADTSDEDLYNYHEDDDDYTHNEEEIEQDIHKTKVLSKNEDIVLKAGEDVSFQCLVDDLSNNQLIWTKRPGEKGEIDQLFFGLQSAKSKKDPRQSVKELEDRRGVVLTIAKARKVDLGSYTCKVAAKYNSSAEFNLVAASASRWSLSLAIPAGVAAILFILS